MLLILYFFPGCEGGLPPLPAPLLPPPRVCACVGVEGKEGAAEGQNNAPQRLQVTNNTFVARPCKIMRTILYILLILLDIFFCMCLFIIHDILVS